MWHDSGQIVGGAMAVADETWHAVRFEDGKVIDLADEVVNLDDWTLAGANSISNDGVIVGAGERTYLHGHDRHRREHGFMLVPTSDR